MDANVPQNGTFVDEICMPNSSFRILKVNMGTKSGITKLIVSVSFPLINERTLLSQDTNNLINCHFLTNTYSNCFVTFLYLSYQFKNY